MIPLFKVFMSPEASIAASKTLNSGMITQGQMVENFEENLRAYFNHPYILTLNSATSGLTLALRLLDLPQESEVLTCPLTCTATNWPILANNHTIKWVDVDPYTCNMSITDLRNKITESTRAIMLVHWAGIPNYLDTIKTIIDEAEVKYGHRIHIIEDCAHAFGSKYNDRYIGTHGNIAVFSLQAIKHLTSVDGGLIFLPNEEIYRRAKLLRWFGIDREVRSKGDFRMEPDIPEWGYKFHMNDVNASVGLANLPYINNNIARIREVADRFYKEFNSLKNIQLLKIKDGSEPSWWIFTMKVRRRDDFIKHCSNKGVMASMVHKRNDVHSCVSQYKINLPNLDHLESEYVSIPCGWWLTNEEVDKIIRVVKAWDIICDIKIRPIEYDDYNKGFLQLFKQLNGVDINMDFETFKNRVDELIIHQSEVLVVEYQPDPSSADGKIIATAKHFIENKFYDNVVHIEDVICDSKYRRYGIATLLIKNIISNIRDPKVYKIILNAQDKNEAFYKSLNFISDSREYKIYTH